MGYGRNGDEAVDDLRGGRDQRPGRVAGRPRRRRRRWLRAAAAVLAASALAVTFWLRSPSPVGHWDSAEGQSRYLETYEAAFQDMPATDRTLDIRTDHGIVRVYRFDGKGDGPPLVLVPGTASASPVWADNMDSLLEIGDVYTIDLLGEPGLSVQDRPITSAADEAAWMAQVLEALPEDRVHLVGLSIGGWTAANLAIRHPEHVETLILLDPVHTFDDMPLETIVRSIPASVSWFPTSWRDSFTSYTAGGAPVEDVPVADMIEAGMKHYSMKKPQPTRITEEQLGTLSMPVLVFIAGRSVMHDPEVAAATAQRALPDARVIVHEDASHAINGEYPDRIASEIADFVGP